MPGSASEGRRSASADGGLRINEIFHSIQGESTRAGLPTVFVRLTGCPLRCRYCDTAYAFHEGERMSLQDILDRVAGFGARYVTVTGGEPLAQRTCLELLTALCDAGYSVSLETSGALDVSDVDGRVCKVLDIKTPASGEADRNRFENFDHLVDGDQIKFVICDRNDYEWSLARIEEFRLAGRWELLFSPSHGEMDPAALAAWMLADGAPARLQLQVHKYLWGDARGR